MLNDIVERIKVNIAQYTQLFNISTQQLEITTQSNTISASIPDGEYVLSGAIDNGVCSSYCVNDIHTFENGVATTDSFMGDAATTQNVNFNIVNVGTALNNSLAIETVNDKKTGNSIIVFWKDTSNTKNTYNDSVSQDLTQRFRTQIGIICKIKVNDKNTLSDNDCFVLDEVLANCVIDTEDKDKTLIRFDSIIQRFYSNEFYCVELAFSFEKEIRTNEEIIKRLKNFEASINNLQVR